VSIIELLSVEVRNSTYRSDLLIVSEALPHEYRHNRATV
jgi:hypothetical protein